MRWGGPASLYAPQGAYNDDVGQPAASLYACLIYPETAMASLYTTLFLFNLLQGRVIVIRNYQYTA